MAIKVISNRPSTMLSDADFGWGLLAVCILEQCAFEDAQRIVFEGISKRNYHWKKVAPVEKHRKNKRWSSSDLLYMQQLRNDGLSHRAIAEIFGVNEENIAQRLWRLAKGKDKIESRND